MKKPKKMAAIDALRSEWSSQFPSMLEKAVEDYKNFAATQAPSPSDAKLFSAYHAACRSALAHLEQLIKFSRWADGDESSCPEGESVEQLIARAEAAVNSHPMDDEDE